MVRLHVQHDHKHKHEMDCVQMTNNADTHTIELENEGSRHIASRSLGMVFLDIFFITILMSLLRINYTYERRWQEQQGGRWRPRSRHVVTQVLAIFFFLLFFFSFSIKYITNRTINSGSRQHSGGSSRRIKTLHVLSCWYNVYLLFFFSIYLIILINIR